MGRLTLDTADWNEVMFTPTQRAILCVLADGKPHSRLELYGCLPMSSKPASIHGHLVRLRKVLRQDGEDVLCVWHYGAEWYQLAALPRVAADGGLYWLNKEFEQRVRERDSSLCTVCGGPATRVCHLGSWDRRPHLRYCPTNGAMFCDTCSPPEADNEG